MTEKDVMLAFRLENFSSVRHRNCTALKAEACFALELFSEGILTKLKESVVDVHSVQLFVKTGAQVGPGYSCEGYFCEVVLDRENNEVYVENRDGVRVFVLKKDTQVVIGDGFQWSDETLKALFLRDLARFVGKI